MKAASTIRISKIEVKKDKNGAKYTSIELSTVIDASDEYPEGVRMAITQMKANPSLKSVELDESALNKNLAFYFGEGMSSPMEVFQGVELRKFRIKRDKVGVHEDFVMKYRFTVKAEEASRWISPVVADDLLCTVEDTQPSLPM